MSLLNILQPTVNHQSNSLPTPELTPGRDTLTEQTESPKLWKKFMRITCKNNPIAAIFDSGATSSLNKCKRKSASSSLAEGYTFVITWQAPTNTPLTNKHIIHFLPGPIMIYGRRNKLCEVKGF